MRFYIFIVILLYSVQSFSQDWEMVSEGFSQVINCMYEDPVSDELFIGGQFRYIGADHFGGLTSYNGAALQNYGCAYGCGDTDNAGVTGPFSIVSYHDTLYLTGIARTGLIWDSLFNDIPDTKGVIRYAGGEFSAMDVSFANEDYSTNHMRIFNVDDTLYVTANHMGNVAGFSGYGAAMYDGYEWSPFFIPSCNELVSTTDLIKYDGDLYISGSFNGCEYPTNDIMMWNGEEWEVVGNPIATGTAAGIRHMVVFQDELYVCGLFFRNSGNAGECIMKWNGEEWSDLGSGLGASGLNTVDEMVILNNELYICGRFTEAGGIPAHNLAKWDGNQWCAIEHEFTSLYIRQMGVYNDELYVYAKTEDNISRLWKWTGTATTCSEEFNSINEQTEPESLTLCPNPASDHLTITLPKQFYGLGTISITDGVGRMVQEFTQEIEAGGQMTIATLNLPVGLYTLKFRHEEGVYAVRFVKE